VGTVALVPAPAMIYIVRAGIQVDASCAGRVQANEESHVIIPIAVVPVAGLGTRLLPATKSQPKEMLPVAKKPVVQYVVEELEANDIRQILFITGKSKTSIENHFDFDHELMRNLREGGKEELLAELEYERMPIQFFFTRQRRQKGLGDAVLCGRLYTQDSPFVVALGDSIIGLNGSSQILGRMARVFEATGAACVIAVESVPLDSVSSYGIVKPGDSLSEPARDSRGTSGNAASPHNSRNGDVFVIEDVTEKPLPESAPSNLAIAARYIFSPEIYPALEKTPPGKNGEIQLTDAIQILLQAGRKIVGVRLAPEERRYDIGNFESYFEAFIEFAIADPQLGPTLRKSLPRLLAR
jgi:UTP--glucose-1-phosphate uridylyltransferase